MSKGERMSHNANLALNFTRQLLELPFDPENLKLLGHQKDAALTIISQQIRIEAERLREPRARGEIVREFYEHYSDATAPRKASREQPIPRAPRARIARRGGRNVPGRRAAVGVAQRRRSRHPLRRYGRGLYRRSPEPSAVP